MKSKILNFVSKFRIFLKYKKIPYGKSYLYIPRLGYSKKEIDDAKKWAEKINSRIKFE